VEAQIENGSWFRILTILDEHNWPYVAVHAARPILAVDVITVLEAAIARYGAPAHLRSDNGTELIAHAIQDWLAKGLIKTMYITLGSLWENAHIEIHLKSNFLMNARSSTITQTEPSQPTGCCL
jgi:putative transposase